uniref:CDK14 n=1 Tax=Chelonoidis abingdonii TaxID=106734 RepID=A0A8C0HIC4_CHEAB
MSTRNCQGMDSVIKPLDTIPEDKKVRVQRTQSSFDPFEKPTSQVKRVHSENNACINFKTTSAGKESPKVRRHSSPSSVSASGCIIYVITSFYTKCINTVYVSYLCK